MTLVEVLRAAREKIAKGWCQGAYSRNLGGEAVSIEDGEQFCPIGAVATVTTDFWYDAPVLRAIGLCLPKLVRVRGIPWWNDRPNRTQAQVLALFDKAIRKAERT